MPVSTLTLEKTQGRGRNKKTRTFSVRLLGFILADSLWESGSGDEMRPAWIAYLGTDAESQAFTSNFRGSRQAKTSRYRFQILKKAPYRWSTRKVPGGVVTTAYLPDLFHLDPTDPAAEKVRFVFAPPRWWVERQSQALEAEFGTEADEAARAALFAAYLDRRTPLPVLGELRFHLELYRAALEAEWVYPSKESSRAPGPLFTEGAELAGFDPVLAISADQDTLTDFLVEQTSRFQPSEETTHGTDRIPSDCRLLPHSEAPAALDQLHAQLAG